jgi:DNA-binding CsgD family transcriptional regulator
MLVQNTDLTPREREIALLAASGLPDKVISSKLQVSVGTVKAHLHNVYLKLRIRGRSALAERLASEV